MVGNYAPALLAEAQAHNRGFNSALWLDGPEGRFDTILPGITRDSAIRVLQAMGTPVEERPVLIDEIVEAHTAGRL